MLCEFIENSKLLINALGYKVLDKIDISLIKKSEEKQKFFFINAKRDANAKGLLVADGFLVTKGSKIATGTTQSMSESLVKLRNKLINKGIIDKEYSFVYDYVFTSPSLAASIVMGRNANGRTEWKTVNNKCINDFEQ